LVGAREALQLLQRALEVRLGVCFFLCLQMQEFEIKIQFTYCNNEPGKSYSVANIFASIKGFEEPQTMVYMRKSCRACPAAELGNSICTRYLFCLKN
jgi:hypothetical protein